MRVRAVSALSLPMLFLAFIVSGCTSSEKAKPAATPRPVIADAEYQTQSSHFRALQRAGLSGDFKGFAKHLGLADQSKIAAMLGRAFGNQPFDVYTWKTAATSDAHSRLIELRNRNGRLYLFVRLDRVRGGWYVANSVINRDRSVIAAKL